MTVTKAQKKATAKYEKENYDKILLRLPKGTKERIQASGKSVNGYITRVVLEDLERQEEKTDPQKADSLPDFMKD